jgi:hypothetical protein
MSGTIEKTPAANARPSTTLRAWLRRRVKATGALTFKIVLIVFE